MFFAMAPGGFLRQCTARALVLVLGMVLATDQKEELHRFFPRLKPSTCDRSEVGI